MSKRAAGGRKSADELLLASLKTSERKWRSGRKSEPTEAQQLLAIHLRELKFVAISFEHRFNSDRKWSADICAFSPAPDADICLFEADGGKWHGGHKRGQALEDDYERQNWAIAHGYKMYRFTNQQILDGRAKSFIAEHLLGQKGREG